MFAHWDLKVSDVRSTQMIAMAIVAKTMPRVLVRSLPEKNITSLLKILAAFEKVAEINLYFTAFFNEFPVYLGNAVKLKITAFPKRC